MKFNELYNLICEKKYPLMIKTDDIKRDTIKKDEFSRKYIIGYVAAYIDKYSEEEFLLNKKGSWISFGEDPKFFKTKSKALKFAKKHTEKKDKPYAREYYYWKTEYDK